MTRWTALLRGVNLGGNRSLPMAKLKAFLEERSLLVRRPLGTSNPQAAHKGMREAYMGGRWHKANLYEMDLLQPGHEVTGPAIIEHPATTLVVHPNDRVFIDEWTLLHYNHA